MIHTPVLLKEIIELLDLKEGEIIIDGTAGSGGHSKAILQKIGKTGQLLLIDWDKESVANLKKAFAGYSNVSIIQSNYAELPGIIAENHFPKADGLLLDLGFSSEQLERSGRGFSFNPPAGGEPLDMRYDAEDDERPTAASIVNGFSEKELADIIYEYGEERFSRQIAKKLVERRKKERFKT